MPIQPVELVDNRRNADRLACSNDDDWLFEIIPNMRIAKFKRAYFDKVRSPIGLGWISHDCYVLEFQIWTHEQGDAEEPLIYRFRFKGRR